VGLPIVYTPEVLQMMEVTLGPSPSVVIRGRIPGVVSRGNREIPEEEPFQGVDSLVGGTELTGGLWTGIV
jgi:hypothetical protein